MASLLSRTIPFLLFSTMLASLPACASDVGDADGEVASEAEDALSVRVSARLGTIGFGEERVATLVAGTSYAAFKLSGTANDAIHARVASQDGDAYQSRAYDEHHGRTVVVPARGRPPVAAGA
jgi:hypothetical protein